MIGSVHRLEKARAEGYARGLYNADHVDINDIAINLDTARIQLHSYHLPVFVYKNSLSDNVLVYKFVNGYSGKFVGDRSPWKLFVLGGMVGASAVPVLAGIGDDAQIIARKNVCKWDVDGNSIESVCKISSCIQR